MSFPSYLTHPARLAIVAVVVFGLAAASAKRQGNSSHPAKVLPQQTSTATNTSSTASSASASTNSSYIIGPGDLLAINVLHEPEVSQKVPVRMDGKITMPLIGEIQASGMKPGNLQETIAAKLNDYIKNAEVTVVVEEIKSRQFTVVGEVDIQDRFHRLRRQRCWTAWRRPTSAVAKLEEKTTRYYCRKVQFWVRYGYCPL